MHATPIGVSLVVAGVLFFFFWPQLLYACAVFFVPFSATAVANAGYGDTEKGVPAWLFFGLLWILREFTAMSRRARPLVWDLLSRPRRQLAVFLFIVFLSLLVPLWANGTIWVRSPELMSNQSVPLVLTVEHVTQTLYLVFGAAFAFFFAVKNSQLRQFQHTVRIFTVSAIFAGAWGLFQWFCYFEGVSYPSYIFNTSATPSAQGYLQKLESIDLGRISSVATEPSMFAECVLVAVAFILPAVLLRRPLISKKWDRVGLLLMVSALLLSTAMTAYLGLLVLLLWGIGCLVYLRVLKRRYILVALTVLLTFVATLAVNRALTEVAEAQILGKMETYSALERINSILLAAHYFREFPILGLGWGSVGSHDLVFKLLSNVGITGFLAFALFAGSMLRRLWRTTRVGILCGLPAESYGALQLFIAATLLLMLNAVTEFAFAFAHLWFVLGMALAAPLLTRQGALLPSLTATQDRRA